MFTLEHLSVITDKLDGLKLFLSHFTLLHSYYLTLHTYSTYSR